MTLKIIESAAFPGVYLRIDGEGVDRQTRSGGGVVNCQFGAGLWEVFDIVEDPSDGTATIRSTAFENVFLRLDGSEVNEYHRSGSGKVNCQYGAGSFEKFRLNQLPNGKTIIQSVRFPDAVLRMDGEGVTRHSSSGGGKVNAQYQARDWEQFWIRDPAPGLTRQELQQAIESVGPVLRFYPRERYLPCSVEAFLQHATLHDGKTGATIDHPTPSQLPTDQNYERRRYWMTISDDFLGGDLSTAKAYVHAYWKPGMQYTDLQFWFLYAYNGPGTLYLALKLIGGVVHDGSASLAPLGEHYGDWECCMIRIDNQSKKMTGAWLSQHSAGQMFKSSQLDRFSKVNGTQPVVYSSRNGHAVYASTGLQDTQLYEVRFPLGGAFGLLASAEAGFRNDTADGGQSLDCARNYELVSADWLPANERPSAAWLNYPYRWGPEGTHSKLPPARIREIIYAAVKWPGGTVWDKIVDELAAAIVNKVYTDDVNGPEGPKTKSTWNGNYGT